MKKCVAGGVILAIGLCFVSADLGAGTKIKTKGVKCIIQTKKAINPSKFAEHNGGKVYFCCGNCLAKFKSNPKKLAAAANAQLVATGQAKQLKCPLAGRALNPATKISVGGADVCFCCFNCQKAAKGKSGAAQISFIFADTKFKKAFKVGGK